MLSERASETTAYALPTAAVLIGMLLVAAFTTHWHADLFAFSDIVYFAALYWAVCALSFSSRGRLRVGIEGTALLAAFFSIGQLGALLALGVGHLAYDVSAALWKMRTEQTRQSLVAFSLQAASNLAIRSFGCLLAAQVYFALGGALPLASFAAAQLIECLAALIAYNIAVNALQVAVAYYLSRRTAQPFAWRTLRFIPLQAFAYSLAPPAAIVYTGGDFSGNLIAIGLLLAAALTTRIAQRDYFALTRRVDALATLNTVGQALSRNLTVTDLVESLYEQVRRVMDASIFYVALYDPRTEQVSFPLSVNLGERRSWQSVPLSGITGYIIRTGKPFLMRGTLEETSAQLRKLGIERHGEPSRCYLGVPMRSEDEVLGVIAVQSLTDPNAYDRDDLAFLEIIAAQAATALQNIRLYEDLFSIADRLALLNEVSGRMMTSFDLDIILKNACQALQAAGNAESAVIFLFDPEHQSFALRSAADLPQTAQRALSAACSACLHSALQENMPIVVDDVAALPDESAWRTYAAAANCRGLLALPLRLENQPIGMAVAHYSAPPFFEQSVLELLIAFANQLAAALANARHHADIEQRAQELTQLVEASRAFTASLDLPHIAERLFDDLERLFAPTTLTVRQLLPDGALQLVASRTSSALPIAQRLLPVGSVAQALQTQRTQSLPQSPEDSALLAQFGYAQALVIPIVNDGQTFGAVSIFHAQPIAISGRAQQLAEALVNQAALALRNAQAYQQVDTALEARVEELSAIESISRKISGALNLDVIINEVLRAALEHTDADLVSVLLLPTHEIDHRVRLERFLAREEIQFVMTQHAFDGIIGQVLRTGSAVRLEDTRLAPNYVQPSDQPMLSELCVPIIYKGQRVGVINLESRRLAAFNAAHERFLTNLAEHAAIALGTTQLFQRLEYQINTLQRLRALSLEMLTAGSLSATLNLLADAVLKTIRNGSVHLLLYNHHPAASNVIQAAPLSVPYSDPNAYETIRLPIQRGGHYFGEFIICPDDPADLGDNRVHALELIAIQAAIALQNIRLFEEVRARRDQMQTVFDAVREGMLLISGDGVLLLANRAAEQLLNQPLNTLQGQSVRRMELPFSEALKAELLREPIRRRYRLTVNDTARDIEETTIPVLDALNTPVSRLIVLRDITQEEALKEFQQEVSNMLVHDLRGPIASVISSLQLLQDLIAAQDYDDLANVVEIALSSAHAQMHLIESLLDIARLETRRMPMNLTCFALPVLIGEVLKTFETTAQMADVRLINLIEPQLPEVYADREQIRRVLYNLLDNALRHTPSGGQVRLSAQLNGLERMLTVDVTDTGRGVPPELRKRIFEKFTQISGSAVRGHRGSGLGLTFCQLSIEAHGGKIWVESGAEGGAAFFFTLPLAAQQTDTAGE
jgi:GAF domain-containing protein